MLPGKSDPRWAEIVTSEKELELSSIASKMLLMRVKMMTKNDKSTAKVNEAIDAAYDFFSKNQEVVKTDIEKLFK